MKTYTLLVFFCFYSVSIFSQSIIAEDTIKQNTIWNTDTVFVKGNVFIPDSINLNIEPGVNVIVNGYYYIDVKGSLTAKGAKADMIKFTISDTTGFSDTSVVAGGWQGIHFNNVSESNDSSIFDYCIIEYAKVITDTLLGGGISAKDFSKIRISNSIIQHNYSYKQGGGLLFINSSPIISNNEFYYNKTYYYGGGIYIEGESNALIKNNLFKDNSAFKLLYGPYGTGGGGCGSAVYVTNEELYNTQNPIIINNKCFSNESVDGTIYESTVSSKVINNVICNNFGDGITNGHQLSHCIYSNNTVCNNYAPSGGITVFSNGLKMLNNIVWGNSYCYQTPQIYFLYGESTIEYNCIEGGGFKGEGNIDRNPEFVNPSPGVGLDYEGDQYDWSLSKNSPCINAGTPDTTDLYLPQYDMAGNLRIMHDTIDIGAFEYQSDINSIFDFETTAKKFTVYPNPATNFVNISFTQNINANKFEIYNITGKLILLKQLESSLTTINVTDLSKGLYFYRIKYDDKTIDTGKFIKQ
ncbi:MAG: T9SS type A sorting domain-containing protein [Bacteroidetes bacterium]|nr:T9SS type A sorting domain-containing protein [Bacteroidota bacterium]